MSNITVTGQIWQTLVITGGVLNSLSIMGQIDWTPPATSYLLLESGGTDNLLLETGDNLLLE